MRLAIDMHDPAGTPDGQLPTAEMRTAAIPFSHCGTIALYQPADALIRPTNTAVLLLSPWGFEEICTRKFWRVLAEEFSARGMPCLRFDYPGTGDSLDIDGDAWQPGSWRASVIEFAGLLRKISGCDRILLVGQGLGATLAYEASADVAGFAGLALLAPVLDGRSYLRELSVWSRMNEPMTASRAPDHLVLGGEVISQQAARDVRGLKMKARLLDVPVFLAPREGQTAATDLATQLRAQGTAVDTLVYDEYPALISNLTLQTLPTKLLRTITAWAEQIAPGSHPTWSAELPQDAEACLSAPDFVETHVRFDQGRLHGVICEPVRSPASGARVILLNPSYEKAAGWGRAVSSLARDLAREGIWSLRFDMANVGDSVPREGAPEQVLYTDSQLADVEAAINLTMTRSPGPIVVAGRCSGAYLGFRALLTNHRIAGAVIGNTYTLEWDPNQSLDDLLRFVPQRLSSYTSKILTLESWRKILGGQVSLRHGITNISRQAFHKAAARLKPLLARARLTSQAHGTVQQAVGSIAKRGAALTFVYTEGDIGLDYFRRHFDIGGGRLAEFPEVGFRLVQDAEHNMLTPEARDALTDEIVRMAKAFGPGHGMPIPSAKGADALAAEGEQP